MTRICFAILIIVACSSVHSSAQVPEQQSLSDRLMAEGTRPLAVAARAKGDAVRGAILFSTNKLACIKCHAQGATDRLGPDLTRVSADRTDEHFVESILLPSKVIAKGFESVKVLLEDGRVTVGRIISQDDQQIILRDASSPERTLAIKKTEIQRLDPDAISAMPNNLADQLTDRQQFLDLVRYLMDIAQSGLKPVNNQASRTTEHAVLHPRIQGLVLIDRFGCVNCHRNDMDGLTAAAMAPRKKGPILTSATSRIDPSYITRFIANPDHVKPGTTMPDVMSRLSAEHRREASVSITHYLLSLSDRQFGRKAIDPKAAARGDTLFHSVGCVACHLPRNDDGIESAAPHSAASGDAGSNDAAALGDLTRKYSVEGLAGFLESPHDVRPSGRMPDMKLSHWEAIDLANYLLANATDDASQSPMALDAALIPVGRRYFRQLGCAQCHLAESDIDSANQYSSISELDVGRGCLSSTPGDWPVFPIDDSQRDAIRRALDRRLDPLDQRESVVLTMATFRCYECHQREGYGGVSDDRDIYFETTNENLGPQGRLPPTLTGVGGKLRSTWLRDVLVSGRAIRPYMKTRMPQYGSENVAHLVELFASVDPKPLVEPTELTEPADPKEIRKIGTDLVGNGGLNCIACHTFQQKPSQTMPAVDLTEMAERLHQEWFFQYMIAPQSFNPGTVMPSFWPGGRAIRKDILDGDPMDQIGAIWEYLRDGRQARTPRGLILEPIELLATQGRAVMLRRSYPGIGKRGIGVGYPGDVNLAFDAEQMRLAMIWRGGFADPSGVWRGQGHGNVRPLSRNPIRFSPGPDLDDLRSPWIVDQGRPPNHQFTGYYLDATGRPTFTYRFDGVDVKDYTVNFVPPQSDHAILKRIVTLKSDRPRKQLAFRVADGNSVAIVDPHTFRVGDMIRVHLDQRHQGKVVQTESGARLIVPLDLPSGSTEIEIHYRW